MTGPSARVAALRRAPGDLILGACLGLCFGQCAVLCPGLSALVEFVDQIGKPAIADAVLVEVKPLQEGIVELAADGVWRLFVQLSGCFE